MTTAARGCVKGRESCAGAERRLWLKPSRLGGWTPGRFIFLSSGPPTAAKDLADVIGDVAVLKWIRDRISDALDAAGRSEIDSRSARSGQQQMPGTLRPRPTTQREWAHG